MDYITEALAPFYCTDKKAEHQMVCLESYN